MTSELALVLLLSSPVSTEFLDSLGHAPPSMVERLRRDCVDRRVRITASGTRYDVRVGLVDAVGLGEFSTRGSAPRPPNPLIWPSVERIDAVRSRFLLGTAVGSVTGALIGLPLAFGEGGGQGGLLFALCTISGGWIGGRAGSRMLREHLLYVPPPRMESRPPPESAAAGIAAAGSVATGSAAAGSTATGSAAMGITPTRAEAARIQKACARIGPNSLLRVTFTDKARIEGYTSLADDAGLHALQPKLAHGPLPPLPDVVPWTRIFEVEKRGGSAGSFAIKGALYMGLMGAMIGAAAGAASDAAPSAPVAGAAIGAAVSGAIGAGLGALIGAPIPRWHVVY